MRWVILENRISEGKQVLDPVFSGLDLRDNLATADPLAILVLLGTVAAAVSVSVAKGINTCLAEASGNRTPKADDVVTAWLDSLAHAAVPSVAAVHVSRPDQRVAGTSCAPGPAIGFSSMAVEP